MTMADAGLRPAQDVKTRPEAAWPRPAMIALLRGFAAGETLTELARSFGAAEPEVESALRAGAEVAATVLSAEVPDIDGVALTASQKIICDALRAAAPNILSLERLAELTACKGAAKTMQVQLCHIRARFAKAGRPCPIRTAWGRGLRWEVQR